MDEPPTAPASHQPLIQRLFPARGGATILAAGLCAFGLLVVRFSPNWMAFYRSYKEAQAAVGPAPASVVDRAFFSAYSERGFYVVQQAQDLAAKIDNPVHKIVRWRLLVPLIGHVLHLPTSALLGAAHVGCLVLVVVLAAISYQNSDHSRRAAADALMVALVVGATAPFFTSMGWLGYYDSWLALGLVTIAFARQRWLVIAACLVTPWIDERFVVGLPLALLVRWRRCEDASTKSWLKTDALVPLLLATAYTAVRLGLAGTGGSQGVSDYADLFMRRYSIPPMQRIRGAWEGVRFAWVFIAVALLHGRGSGSADRAGRIALFCGVIATMTIGLFTALDLSRSMVLLLPVAIWGAVITQRAAWWRQPYLPAALAAAALLVPARQVVGKSLVEVENIGSSQSLALAQNNMGMMFGTGAGVPKDSVAALAWYRKAAALGSAHAEGNLGLMYLLGDGVPKNSAAALEWLRRAAAKGLGHAQNDLGAMYTNGDGVAKDWVIAYSWFLLAARHRAEHANDNLTALRAVLTSEQVAQAESLVREWITANPDIARPNAEEPPAQTR